MEVSTTMLLQFALQKYIKAGIRFTMKDSSTERL